MIYFVIGASGSGKTACLPYLKQLLRNFTIFDFDDIGVPENADSKWRQEATEEWIHRLTPNHQSPCCLLGQMVPGEILASPSAKDNDNIFIILLDCADATRIERLRKRKDCEVNQNTLNWAAWLRMHCIDPTWEQHVITHNCSSVMNFELWTELDHWPRFMQVQTIDTTFLSVAEVAQHIVTSINSR